MSFSSRFQKPSSGGSSLATRVLRDQAIVEGFWIPQDSGEKAFVLLHIDKAKYQAYKHAMQGAERVNLEAFGQVIYSGFALPTKEQQAAFREKYGVFSEEEFQE